MAQNGSPKAQFYDPFRPQLMACGWWLLAVLLFDVTTAIAESRFTRLTPRAKPGTQSSIHTVLYGPIIGGSMCFQGDKACVY